MNMCLSWMLVILLLPVWGYYVAKFSAVGFYRGRDFYFKQQRMNDGKTERKTGT